MSDVTVSYVLDSQHLPTSFHILNHVSIRDISAPAENHTDWEQFQSLATNLIPPRIQTDTVEEAEKEATAFTASTAMAYRMSTSKFTFDKVFSGYQPR
jgi:hypothetical protein